MNLLHFFIYVLIASTIALVASFYIKKIEFNKKMDTRLDNCRLDPDDPDVTPDDVIIQATKIEALKTEINRLYQQPFIAGIAINIILILIYSICISINCSRGWFLFWVIVFGVLCDFLLGVIFILALDNHKESYHTSIDIITPPGSPCNTSVKTSIDVVLSTCLGINVHNVVIGVLSLVCLLIQTNKASKIPIPTPPLVA